MVTHAEVKLYRSLQQKKFRLAHGLFVTEGRKSVAELIKSQYQIEHIFGTEDDSSIPNLNLIDKKDLASISSLRTPPTVIAIAHFKKPLNKPTISGPIFLLDSVRDPGNLGTIIRTVRWFGASELILSSDCADIYNPKTIQASMGSLFHLNINTTDLHDSIDSLKASGYKVFGTKMNGSLLGESNLPLKSAFIIGNEGHGISSSILKLCDELIAIEGGTFPGVESLNAAMSVGIIAHHLYLRNNGK